MPVRSQGDTTSHPRMAVIRGGIVRRAGGDGRWGPRVVPAPRKQAGSPSSGQFSYQITYSSTLRNPPQRNENTHSLKNWPMSVHSSRMIQPTWDEARGPLSERYMSKGARLTLGCHSAFKKKECGSDTRDYMDEDVLLSDRGWLHGTRVL